MLGQDILHAFEQEVKEVDNVLTKPDSDDSLYWINQGMYKFVKDRFNGNAPKRTSYEQNEKRTRDLIRLWREAIYMPNTNCCCENCDCVKWPSVFTPDALNDHVVEDLMKMKPYLYEVEVTKSHPSYNMYEYKYPDDMMYVLNEDVIISDLDNDHKMDTCVFECTADSFMYRVNNTLSDFHYRFHRARPLRIRTRDGFRLLTDKKYKINTYSLGYLKVPTEITSEDPEKDYKDFDDHTWLEIIKIAAQMYVENQKDEQRYKTITNEVLTQE